MHVWGREVERVGRKKRICRLQGKGDPHNDTGPEMNFIHGRSRRWKKESKGKAVEVKEGRMKKARPCGSVQMRIWASKGGGALEEFKCVMGKGKVHPKICHFDILIIFHLS